MKTNMPYCSATLGSLLANVQILFRKKFELAASMKPVELATYLLIFTFSFSSQVVPKSINMPEEPTIQNFRNFEIRIPSTILIYIYTRYGTDQKEKTSGNSPLNPPGGT
jgi:hypothetical protein